jgi:hypothetical protein
MDTGKISPHQKAQQEFRVAAVVLLPTSSKLPDAHRVADFQVVSRFLHQPVEPTGVSSGFQSDNGRSWKLLVESTHIFSSVVQRSLLYHAIRRITPADGLRARVKIYSEKNYHGRLLFTR